MEHAQYARPRDSRRSKLYTAEWIIRGPSRPLPTYEARREYVNRVLDSTFVRSRWGRRMTTLARGRGDGGNFRPWTDEIRTGNGATEYVLLHEIAHSLAPRGVAAHGPEFASILLTLVRRFMGPSHAALLRKSFAEHHVKYRGGMRAVPKPGTHTVVTATARRSERRAAISQPVSLEKRQSAAATLRRLIAQGEFGASGTKTRTHALAVARKLENRG